MPTNTTIGPGRLDIVKRMIRPVKTYDDADKLGMLYDSDINEMYLPHAREEMYARLRRYYEVPFREITRLDETDTNVTISFYPEPLDYVVELLAAGTILGDMYFEASGTERYADKGPAYLQKAENFIIMIQGREIMLEGQRLKAEDVFTSPTVGGRKTQVGQTAVSMTANPMGMVQ